MDDRDTQAASPGASPAPSPQARMGCRTRGTHSWVHVLRTQQGPAAVHARGIRPLGSQPRVPFSAQSSVAHGTRPQGSPPLGPCFGAPGLPTERNTGTTTRDDAHMGNRAEQHLRNQQTCTQHPCPQTCARHFHPQLCTSSKHEDPEAAPNTQRWHTRLEGGGSAAVANPTPKGWLTA